MTKDDKKVLRNLTDRIAHMAYDLEQLDTMLRSERAKANSILNILNTLNRELAFMRRRDEVKGAAHILDKLLQGKADFYGAMLKELGPALAEKREKKWVVRLGEVTELMVDRKGPVKPNCPACTP